MAKTKSNSQSENKPPKSQNQTTSTDDEKLDSLKSLNAMLLKETVERRQQVNSLTQINTCLESDLNNCKSDNVSLKSELNGVTERAMMLEIEKESVSRFYSTQVSEMVEKIDGLERDIVRLLDEKSEIEKVKNMKESEIVSLNSRLFELEGEIGEEKFILSKVSEERDEIRAQLEDRIRIENELRLKLAEAETTESVILEKSRNIKVDYDVLFKEKTEIERKMEAIVREKHSIEKSLIESKGLVDKLIIDINKMAEEKKVIEDERDLQEKTKNELQKSVDGLNDLVYQLQKSEEQILKKVADLEKKCAVSSEKEENMCIEIDILVKEKQEIETNFEKLTHEKSLAMKNLSEALKSSRYHNLTIDQLIKEKREIENVNYHGELNIVKLNEQLIESNNTIATLEKSSLIQTNKLKQLESEVSGYKAVFDQATKERNTAQENLVGEKLKVKNLSEKISKLEKEIEEMGKKVSKMQKDTEKSVAEKKELEKARAALENNILVVNNSLAKTRKEHDDTKGKLRVSEANTSRILKILKNTSLICNSKEDDNMGIDEKIEFGEEIKHHVKEVEAIKKAFKDKESIVDEMKKQLDLLKVCVAKADKGKSFWAMVSSATTILAAVSLACVARGGS